MRRQALTITAIWFCTIFTATNGIALGFWPWLMSFNQWDSRWYGSIAMSGHGFLPQSFVFPPGHSWILGSFTDLTYYAFRAFGVYIKWMMVFSLYGLLMNLIAFACSNAALVWLSEKRWNISRSRMWAIAFANPVGYFALTAYSDMLFLALTMGVIVLVLHSSPRSRRWHLQHHFKRTSKKTKMLILAGLLGIAPWFRLTGAAFASLLLIRRKEAIGTLIGISSFLIYYWLRTEDPLYFLKAQRIFQMPEGNVLDGLRYAIAVFNQGLRIEAGEFLLIRQTDFFLYWLNFGLLPLGAFFLSLAVTFWLATRREWELALIIAAITVISHNQAMWRSTVRYALMIYPIASWIWLASDNPTSKNMYSLTKSIIPQIFTGLAVGTGLALQIFYARIFQSGGWAF